MNINYFDALNNPDSSEPLALQIERLVAAHAIMLSLVGVPGIYFHSLFGSRSWRLGVDETGQNRAINREKLDRDVLERKLTDTNSRRYQVFTRLKQLLRARAAHHAFDPYGDQRVMNFGDAIFAVERIASNKNERVLCLHNVSTIAQRINLHAWYHRSGMGTLIDPITRQQFAASDPIDLPPYATLWLADENL